jgi:ABC-type transport system substrate-binding protein
VRRALYAQMERIILDDAPVIFLDYPVDTEAVNSDLHGFRDRGTYGRADRWSL